MIGSTRAFHTLTLRQYFSFVRVCSCETDDVHKTKITESRINFYVLWISQHFEL